MPAPISVIIPTLNAEAELPACADSLMAALRDGLIRDLVVSDGGSTDATRDIAAALGAALVTGPAGRGGQLSRGVAASQGDWLLLLHADSRLLPDWAAAAERFMSEHPDAAGYFRISFRASGSAPAWVAGWARLRARLFGLPYGDQGLLLPRALLDEVGGVPDIPLMEDVALARALRGRLRAIPAGITTGADRYLHHGWLRRGAHNLGTLLRYLAGADPEALAGRYRRGPRGN